MFTSVDFVVSMRDLIWIWQRKFRLHGFFSRKKKPKKCDWDYNKVLKRQQKPVHFYSLEIGLDSRNRSVSTSLSTSE
jgi:hypothetical protein